MITGCLFKANWGDPGGALSLNYIEAELTDCSIKNSTGPMGNVALHTGNDSSLHCYNTIIAFGTDQAVACAGGSGAAMYYCDICGNQGGDCTGCIMSQGGNGGNFSADPLFCWPYGTPSGLRPARTPQPPGEPCTAKRLLANDPQLPLRRSQRQQRRRHLLRGAFQSSDRELPRLAERRDLVMRRRPLLSVCLRPLGRLHDSRRHSRMRCRRRRCCGPVGLLDRA